MERAIFLSRRQQKLKGIVWIFWTMWFTILWWTRLLKKCMTIFFNLRYELTWLLIINAHAFAALEFSTWELLDKLIAALIFTFIHPDNNFPYILHHTQYSLAVWWQHTIIISLYYSSLCLCSSSSFSFYGTSPYHRH